MFVYKTQLTYIIVANGNRKGILYSKKRTKKSQIDTHERSPVKVILIGVNDDMWNCDS